MAESGSGASLAQPNARARRRQQQLHTHLAVGLGRSRPYQVAADSDRASWSRAQPLSAAWSVVGAEVRAVVAAALGVLPSLAALEPSASPAASPVRKQSRVCMQTC